MALLGASGLTAMSASPARAAEPPTTPPWMQFPGAPLSGYGSPSKYESKVTRILIQSQPGTTGSGGSRTPLEALDGMLTPSGLHFERHHSGVPDIDPDKHRLLIHSLVKRPLIFTMDALLRYPVVPRLHFLDGGQTWAAAALSAPVLPRALTRFRIAWQWNGTPTVLKSRATGDTGAVQPTRDALIAAHGTNVFYHYNAIQAWQVEANGEVKNVYA
jgi:hypothetical protein